MATQYQKGGILDPDRRKARSGEDVLAKMGATAAGPQVVRDPRNQASAQARGSLWGGRSSPYVNLQKLDYGPWSGPGTYYNPWSGQAVGVGREGQNALAQVYAQNGQDYWAQKAQPEQQAQQEQARQLRATQGGNQMQRMRMLAQFAPQMARQAYPMAQPGFAAQMPAQPLGPPVPSQPTMTGQMVQNRWQAAQQPSQAPQVSQMPATPLGTPQQMPANQVPMKGQQGGTQVPMKGQANGTWVPTQ